MVTPSHRQGAWPPRRRKKAPETIRETLLRQPVRSGMVENLDTQPGMNKSQLTRAVDTTSNNLDFHLKRLKKAGIIATRPGAEGNQVLCFLEEDADLWENPRTRVLFGRPHARKVAMFLAGNPGATSRDIGGALGLSRETVCHHIRRLRKHGLVEDWRIGRQRLYHPAPDLEEWAVEVGPLFQGQLDG